MHRLTIVLVLGMFGCGDDVCWMDPDTRAFWTQEQRDACPAAPRPRHDDATPPLPDMGAAPDLVATMPTCITGCN